MTNDQPLINKVNYRERFIHPLLQEHFARLDVEAVLEQKTPPSKFPTIKPQI